ncbi:ornithine cyclodeaminase family protein [Ferrimonas marina]|uniref:Ornithine cyclodeaminase n=1 Tax=Ferrimonas marina TaxID=299255 RepID=A0A1M5MPG1_9GAMM|nr:ornithine cyclodeaminase family protein [Ferrimonas marina]SHG79188.1 ornithine cyclodeaminase [Ferrimonas marina]
MWILSEQEVKQLADEALAFDAVSQALVAAYRQNGTLNPVVIAASNKPGASFSIKSGNLAEPAVTGVKLGGYWPGNAEHGLPNHSTATLLLEEATGLPRALVNAGYLNGLRTAAANAVAVSALARPDSRVLSVLGAGHQAGFEIRAVCRVRPIERVLIANRNVERAEQLAQSLADLDLPIEVVSAEEACKTADILVTVTNATEPLLQAEWVPSGCHISAMGADQGGKQELPVSLALQAECFADRPEQSRQIGELEAAARQFPSLTIDAIGAVLSGVHPGRSSAQAITLFDSSGIAFQDLCCAEAVLQRAKAKGMGTEVAW